MSIVLQILRLCVAWSSLVLLLIFLQKLRLGTICLLKLVLILQILIRIRKFIFNVLFKSSQIVTRILIIKLLIKIELRTLIRIYNIFILFTEHGWIKLIGQDSIIIFVLSIWSLISYFLQIRIRLND